MYAALWRALPGSTAVRLLICLVLAGLVVAGCFLWVFPWVADLLPMNDAAVSSALPSDPVTLLVEGIRPIGPIGAA